MNPCIVIVQSVSSATLSADGLTLTLTLGCLLVPAGGTSQPLSVSVIVSDPISIEQHDLNNACLPAIQAAAESAGYTVTAEAIMVLSYEHANS